MWGIVVITNQNWSKATTLWWPYSFLTIIKVRCSFQIISIVKSDSGLQFGRSKYAPRLSQYWVVWLSKDCHKLYWFGYVDYHGIAQTVCLCFLHQSFVLSHLCLIFSLLIAYERWYFTSTRPLLDLVSPAHAGLWVSLWGSFPVACSCWFLAVPVGFSLPSGHHAQRILLWCSCPLLRAHPGHLLWHMISF